jgi:hypothetical protein
MQLLGAHRREPRHASSTDYLAMSPSVTLSIEDRRDPSESRQETLGTYSVPADAYSAWLEQREAARERETPVRWVVRPRALAGAGVR